MKGFSGFKDIKTGLSNLGKEIAVKADQIPYVGPSSAAFSTYAKAGGGSGSSGVFYDEKATINQPGYEGIKARITNTGGQVKNLAKKAMNKKMTKTKRKIARKVK